MREEERKQIKNKMVLKDLSQEKSTQTQERDRERGRFNFVYLFGVLSKGEVQLVERLRCLLQSISVRTLPQVSCGFNF